MNVPLNSLPARTGAKTPMPLFQSLLKRGIALSLGAAWSLGLFHPMEMIAASDKASKTLFLVQSGTAQGAVICSSSVGTPLRSDAERFVQLVERSTGAKLPILTEAEEAALPKETVRIFVGDSPKAAAAGVDGNKLPAETYRILRKENAIFVAGQDQWPAKNGAPVSRPTLWALNRLLEEGLGVRWLWPGDLGTYTPPNKDFPVTITELTYQPTLELRTLRMRTRRTMSLAVTDEKLDEKLKKEAIQWSEDHQCGQRGNIKMSHAFTHWWETYGKEHPDYFAELPPGKVQPWPKVERVKLRLSNPAVIEQIAAEYLAAGKPEYWNVCPNDSAAFDISEGTRAWDIPLNQSIDDIFSGKANLTARYVEFWNRLYARLAQINPDVKLAGFAYSSYRQPPPPERPLKAKMVLGVVNSYESYDSWNEWRATGASLVLRPNWWYLGEDAPYLPLEKTANFLKFAAKNGMVGMDMDSVRGYWGAQGINYYLGARLMTNPELTLENVLDEYSSAFGGGAAKIREYIAYWQKVTDQYNYQIVRHESGKGEGAYDALVREGKVPVSILSGSKPALVYLYGEDVLAPAYKLLDEASEAIGSPDSEAGRRVEFLRRGLRSMEATREQMKKSIALRTAPTLELRDAFIKSAEELQRLRDEFSTDHSTWGESSAYREHKHKIPVWPQYLKDNKINMDGLL